MVIILQWIKYIIFTTRKRKHVGCNATIFIIWIYIVCESRYYNSQDCTLFGILFPMTVMVIACPCELGLATPTATVSMCVARKYELLIKGGNEFEMFTTHDNSILNEEDVLCLGSSELNELRKYDIELNTPLGFQSIPSKGITTVDNKNNKNRVHIGNFNWFFGHASIIKWFSSN
eukprot:39555_1